MDIIPIFYWFFSIFLILDHFDLIFGPHLIITYHVFFILDYPNFIIFMFFFFSKCTKYQFFTNFSQFLLILTNCGLIFWHPYFFFLFFSIDGNLSCVFYSRILSFHNFLCIFLCQNNVWMEFTLINEPIFYQFLLILTNFGPTLA